MSPSTMISGCTGRVRSGSTVTRPARSRSAPVARASTAASGDAATPAAQTIVCDSSRSVPPPGTASVTPSVVHAGHQAVAAGR